MDDNKVKARDNFASTPNHVGGDFTCCNTLKKDGDDRAMLSRVLKPSGVGQCRVEQYTEQDRVKHDAVSHSMSPGHGRGPAARRCRVPQYSAWQGV